MYNIKTYNKISAAGLSVFDKEKYICGDDVADPQGAIVRSAALHDEVFSKSLLAIARAGAGTNNIPVERCANEGIVVFNTPGANANAVKELVILGLLISSRKIAPALQWAQGLKGNGAEVGKMVEKGKSAFVGPEISGKTLGVIGLGAIGELVANAAVKLGMTVVGYDPFLSVKAALALSPQVQVSHDLKAVYEKADYVTLHLPYNADTKGTINADALSQMKDGVRILNFARGELVDTDSILAALESGKVACYVTDFPNDAVLGVENVVALPHLGASTPESEDNCATMAATELIDYIENGNITHSVNLPDASMAKSSAVRVCVIHKNVPAVINKITGSISSSNINIINMLNKSKGDYAYTMLDIDLDDPAKAEPIAAALQNEANIIRVRVI